MELGDLNTIFLYYMIILKNEKHENVVKRNFKVTFHANIICFSSNCSIFHPSKRSNLYYDLREQTCCLSINI